MDHHEFKANLGYMVRSSQPGLQGKTVSKKQNKNPGTLVSRACNPALSRGRRLRRSWSSQLRRQIEAWLHETLSPKINKLQSLAIFSDLS